MFQHPGTLNGIGQLEVGDEIIPDTSYDIDVTASGRIKSGQGLIRGDLGLMLDTMSGTLRRRNGEKVDVVCDRPEGTSRGHVMTSGPMPGF